MQLLTLMAVRSLRSWSQRLMDEDQSWILLSADC